MSLSFGIARERGVTFKIGSFGGSDTRFVVELPAEDSRGNEHGCAKSAGGRR